jgi:hypothetical protein
MTCCGDYTLFLRSCQLLEVRSLCNQLGSQDALLLQAVGLQVSSSAQHSSDEFGWAALFGFFSKAHIAVTES